MNLDQELVHLLHHPRHQPLRQHFPLCALRIKPDDINIRSAHFSHDRRKSLFLKMSARV